MRKREVKEYINSLLALIPFHVKFAKIAFLVLISIIFLSSFHLLYSKSKAKLVVNESVYDFGIVVGDTVLTHTFSLMNVGGDTLYIKGVRST